MYDCRLTPDFIRQFPRSLGLDLWQLFLQMARDRGGSRAGLRRVVVARVLESDDDAYVRFRVVLE